MTVICLLWWRTNTFYCICRPMLCNHCRDEMQDYYINSERCTCLWIFI